MSAFRRLRQLPLGDLLHRGLLYSLVGVTGWGVFMIGAVHVDTMRRGKGMFAFLLVVRFKLNGAFTEVSPYL